MTWTDWNDGGEQILMESVVEILQAAKPPLPGSYRLAFGSSSTIWQHPTQNNAVIKAPTHEPQQHEYEQSFRVEARVLKALNPHPRIIRCLGPLNNVEPTQHLLLAYAANGNLRDYLKANKASINDELRLKWCKQAAEALAYCHTTGVLHQDLRDDNMLLDANLDLILCDFGGSRYQDIDGGHLPDEGFFDPRDDPCVVTEATEIFGLGSIMYAIMGGYFPHLPCDGNEVEECNRFMREFQISAKRGIFPDTSEMGCGEIITDCWTKRIESAQGAYQRLLGLGHS